MFRRGFFIFLTAIVALTTSVTFSIPKASAGTEYSYDLMGQSAYPATLKPNEAFNVSLEIKNTGTSSWEKSGSKVVRLGSGSAYGETSQQRDYNSEFSDVTWLSPNRPITIDKSEIKTGENTKFNFTIRAPAKAGTYKAYFTPVVDGYAWMNDMGIYWQIIVSDKASVLATTNDKAAEAITKISPTRKPETKSKENLIKDIAPAVVKITCDIGDPKYLHQGSGTLFFNASNNPKLPRYYIMTNLHVVKSETGQSICKIELFPDYKNQFNSLVFESSGYVVPNNKYDFAIITPNIVNQLHAGSLDDLRKYAINDSDVIDKIDQDERGSEVLVIGYPENGGIDFEDGVILGDSYYLNVKYWDTTALIRSGNSGGLAVNYRGEMLGIPSYTRGNIGMLLDTDLMLSLAK